MAPALVAVAPPSPTPTAEHPLAAGVAELEAALGRMPIDAWEGLAATEAAALVTRLMRVAARVSAHQSAGSRAVEASGLAARSGAASTGALLAGAFGGDRAAGDRLVRSGQQLEGASLVRQALAEGKVSQRQAEIAAQAVDRLDEAVTPDQRRRVQQTLVDDAQRYTLRDFRRRADRITDVFAPREQVDEHEHQTLAEREARAWSAASFRTWDNGNGTVSGDFTIPEAAADVLRTTLEALSAPRREHLQERPVPEGAASPQRLGRAFGELCGRLGSATVMGQGPVSVITVDHATAADPASRRAATLSTGTRITAPEAHLAGCRSVTHIATMGPAGLPLDLGRTRREFTARQKIAAAQRDHGCAFPGCDRPPEWTEAHHWRRSWADGGATDLDNCVLLCAHHHRTVHHQPWQLRQARDGVIEFRHPTLGGGVWQRNHRWRP